MGQQNIIELNGKRYDAITGAVLGAATTRGHIQLKTRTMDGVVRGSKIVRAPAPTPIHPPQQTHTSSAAANSPAQGKKMDISRPSGIPVKHHQPQKGKTLMRRAVHKPQIPMKPKIKVQPPSEIAAPSVKTIAKPLAKKLSVTAVDPGRAARAGTATKHHHIRRFQPQAARATEHQARPTIAYHHTAPMPSTITHPVAFAPLERTAPAVQPVSRTAAMPRRPQTDIFEAAIAHATSHEQKAPRLGRSKRHARATSILAGVSAFLILGGFLAYINKPGIEMQVASMKLGFHAQLPGYQPTGYAMQGGVDTTDDGRITVSFRSGDSGYTLSQQPSDWNSQTLLENYVASTASNHQTIQSQGRTIFIYNGSNATWVDGGVRYDLKGNAPLTAGDIVKVASSI